MSAHRLPCPTVRLVHAIRFANSATWDRKQLSELALAAMQEHDELLIRLHELEEMSKACPKFQGRSELA